MSISNKLGLRGHELNYDFEKRKTRRRNLEQIGLNKDIATENLFILKKCFDKYDLKFWLLFGTLLGIYRDGNLIDHDEDIDIGVFHTDEAKLLEALKELLEKEFSVIRITKDNDLITVLRKDEYIDIGILHPNAKKKCMQYQNNTIPTRHFSNVSYLSFNGKLFLVPTKLRRLLIYWYGILWFVPQKNFPAWTSEYSILRKILSSFKRFLKNLAF